MFCWVVVIFFSPSILQKKVVPSSPWLKSKPSQHAKKMFFALCVVTGTFASPWTFADFISYWVSQWCILPLAVLSPVPLLFKPLATPLPYKLQQSFIWMSQSSWEHLTGRRPRWRDPRFKVHVFSFQLQLFYELIFISSHVPLSDCLNLLLCVLLPLRPVQCCVDHLSCVVSFLPCPAVPVFV